MEISLCKVSSVNAGVFMRLAADDVGGNQNQCADQEGNTPAPAQERGLIHEAGDRNKHGEVTPEFVRPEHPEG